MGAGSNLRGIIESNSTEEPKEGRYTRKLAETDSYSIYVNTRQKAITVYVKEYHPGTLVIKQEGIERLLFEVSQSGMAKLFKLANSALDLIGRYAFR